MKEKKLHSFEAGRRGKPDEFESGLATLIGAHILSIDEYARFDLRVNGGYDHQNKENFVYVGGEVTAQVIEAPDFKDEVVEIVRDRYEKIYKSDEKIGVDVKLTPQSSALAQNEKAGDSGTSIAVAYKNTPNNLPWERYLAVGIRDLIDIVYMNEGEIPEFLEIENDIDLGGLRADGKVEVSATYVGAEFQQLEEITIAVEHDVDWDIEDVRSTLNELIDVYLSKLSEEFNQDLGDYSLSINSAGAFHQGGWITDAGTREAKPYRDGFSSYGVCEDSFTGEDPSKPSATGTMAARYVAQSIVKEGIADFARVTIAYRIGSSDVKINVYTQNTSTIKQDLLEKKVKAEFPLKINEVIEELGLRDPNIYLDILKASDYFQDAQFPWNKFKKFL
jgi:S-adenosylmethionine synthetase